MAVDHPTFGTFCAICFAALTRETCVVDIHGVKWDICPGDCARYAGVITDELVEADRATRRHAEEWLAGRFLHPGEAEEED